MKLRENGSLTNFGSDYSKLKKQRLQAQNLKPLLLQAIHIGNLHR